ncbi:MAG TPA: helix-turn-helix domain-containing GNAT family N-acetyltransferase [Chloroflexota bacterium]|jgi:DNA-binding MarR family transcriptional regulator/GNAT superfamily N-acetyltransferase|nr:helix-turn-helix domain-containing GNAT family N-acetyltransferase [Chloroflexota bacterium]
MTAGATTEASTLPTRVAAVRRFNRFYTRQTGLLDRGYLRSPFSLAEVRVLYELAHAETAITAVELGRALGLDAGYLSRILRGFTRHGLIERQPSVRDGRQQLIRLTPRGRAVFSPLEVAAREHVGTLLSPLSESDQQRLVEAMRTIEMLLVPRPSTSPPARPRVSPFVLRPPQPGDLGWVVQRHGALYAAEYGYDEGFEALVAGIVAHFVERFDPRRERCWIAERDGQPIGCIFLVRASNTIGKLRLFLVEPSARGHGIGARLVEECVRFARLAGYRRIRLWTQSELLAARYLYARAGFRCIAEEPHHSWSKDLVSETWELRL